MKHRYVTTIMNQSENNFLIMDQYYSTPLEVKISMVNDLKKVVTNFLEDIKWSTISPSKEHLLIYKGPLCMRTFRHINI